MIGTTTLEGWEAVRLTGDRIEVTVLPGKGADIVSVRDRETGLDPLLRTPWGLSPPGSPPRPGSGDFEFVANYEGGWQTLFPSVNGPATFAGGTFPFHGEVALRAWRWDAVDANAVRLSIDSELVPLRLERTVRLDARAPRLHVEDAVANLGDERTPFVLGHHSVFGPP